MKDYKGKDKCKCCNEYGICRNQNCCFYAETCYMFNLPFGVGHCTFYCKKEESKELTSRIKTNKISRELSKEYDLTDDGTGKKYDTGKPMVGALCRVFPRALMAVGSCIEFGTHKYPKPDNWKLVEDAFLRYQDSLMRHYLKHCQGIKDDNETNKLHLAHMAWNTLAILELYLMEHPEEMEELNK